MNGRAYDYNLGRFLSVDPFIQFPENSQSMNPYSYIMNNPLSGTDPSGYTAELEDKVKKARVRTERVAKAGSRIKNQTETTVSGTTVNGDSFSVSSLSGTISAFGISFDNGNDDGQSADQTQNSNSIDSLGKRQETNDGTSVGEDQGNVSPDNSSERSAFREGVAFGLDLLGDGPDEHAHVVRTWACNDVIQTGCTEQNLFDNGLLYANAPTSAPNIIIGFEPRGTPIQNGEDNFAWPVGWVRTEVDRQNWTIINRTLPDHILYPGTIIRQIVRERHDLLIETRGVGFGSGANTNNFFAPIIWGWVDAGLINRVDMYPRTRPR